MSLTSSATATGTITKNATTVQLDAEILKVSQLSQSNAIKVIENNSTDLEYGSNTTFDTKTGVALTPWEGGIINGYYMWQGNFLGSSPIIVDRAQTVKEPQIYGNPVKSNIKTGFSKWEYSGKIPISGTGELFNCICFFTQWSNVYQCLDTMNFTTGQNNYNIAVDYFKTNNISQYLLSIAIGGGNATQGGWNTGVDGAMYSVYETVTQKGQPFSYTETATKKTLTGIGTGVLNPSLYNSICFDIETWGQGQGDTSAGSTGLDFLNVCNYIKKNIYSTFYDVGCTIIITTSKTCPYGFDGTTAYETMTTILSDPTGSYDYISPQMYSQYFGVMTEYTQNMNLNWTQFSNCLKQNYNYKKYGSAFIVPSLYFLGLLTSGGSNQNNSPNLYWWMSGSSIPPYGPLPIYEYSYSTEPLTYAYDTGIEDFLNLVLGTNSQLGGGLQWTNGVLQPNV